MRLVVLLLSVLLAALSLGAFLVPTGPLAVAARVAIFVVVVAQAITSYLAIKSTSKAGAEARLEINDVLAPLAVALKNIPLETTARRRRSVVSFLTAATAVCIQLAEGPKLRATFFEVVDRDGSRAFAPTYLSVGRGDPPASRWQSRREPMQSPAPPASHQPTTTAEPLTISASSGQRAVQ